jgi:hypothetical protein
MNRISRTAIAVTAVGLTIGAAHLLHPLQSYEVRQYRSQIQVPPKAELFDALLNFDLRGLSRSTLPTYTKVIETLPPDSYGDAIKLIGVYQGSEKGSLSPGYLPNLSSALLGTFQLMKDTNTNVDDISKIVDAYERVDSRTMNDAGLPTLYRAVSDTVRSMRQTGFHSDEVLDLINAYQSFDRRLSGQRVSTVYPLVQETLTLLHANNIQIPDAVRIMKGYKDFDAFLRDLKQPLAQNRSGVRL